MFSEVISHFGFSYINVEICLGIFHLLSIFDFQIRFDDPNALHEFTFSIVPDEGLWQGGKFKFRIRVPEDYNLSPPVVKCLTRLWHPNINEDGDVCLSLLRLNALDGMGWAPTRKLKDVIWGLHSLFGDLLNFEDPLNIEAAEHYSRDKDGFKSKVREWVAKYAGGPKR